MSEPHDFPGHARTLPEPSFSPPDRTTMPPPDSDAPTPREATLREALDAVDAALRAMPGKKYGNRVAVDTVNRWEAMRVVAAALRLQAAASTAAAGEGATGDADADDRKTILAYRRHLGRGCECPRWPECNAHDAKEWGGGEPDMCSPHGHVLRATSETPRETPLAAMTGVEVHAAWRDGMLAQGRPVSREWMHWGTLTDEDRELDDDIARRLTDPAAAARGSE